MGVQLASERRGGYAPPAPIPDDAAVRTTRAALALLFGPAGRRGFATRLWTGATDQPDAGTPPFTLVLRHPGALRRMFVPPTELNLAESYLRDDYDIEGDIERATLLADEAAERLRSPAAMARLMALVLSLPRPPRDRHGDGERLAAWRRLSHYVFRHGTDRDAAAQRFAYDTSNAFYQLWLDERMQYTCAYFRTGAESLDEAQRAKLDLICRKLRLQPGDRLLDVGCGWGGLLQHAAQHYGATGYGVTLSPEQAAHATDAFRRAGVADRCRVDVRHYRDIDPAARFTKAVAVGSVEHMGVAKLPEVYAKVYGVLEPGGLFLNHLIVTVVEAPAQPGAAGTGRVLRQHNRFIQKYIFPDAEMPTITEVVTAGERVGFEIRDVESLREHYVQTFRHWVRRLEARHDEVAALVGERTYRAFRLYLAAFPPRFEHRWMGISQVLMSRDAARRGQCRLPRTREDVYRASGEVLA